MIQQKDYYENILKNVKDGTGVGRGGGVGYLNSNSVTKNISKLNGNMNDENQIIMETQLFLNEMNLAKTAYKLETNNLIITNDIKKHKFH